MANVYQLDRTRHVGQDVEVTVYGNSNGMSFDPATDTTQIELPDGEIEIIMGRLPNTPRGSVHFDSNLAEHLSESELSGISEKLLMGIEQDEQSRSEWMENMRDGIALLALQLKTPRGAAASGAAPAEGTSTVDHPLLLESVLRFQANARGELLPSDGPVKVRNDGEGNAMADALATALEKDLNHYLTKVATEYVPDTDRMLLQLGFSGISFKKGWHDPIKRRPVIASIDAKDLIVSNAATDLEGSGRVTHCIRMRPSMMRRMQLVGAYRDIHLPSPGTPANQNVVDAEIGRVQGIAPPTYVEPEDQDRELFECYCEIDVPGFEHELEGEMTGLPLPYIVTMDKEARRILAIRRNWEEDDMFCMPRNRIVAYTFIPGLGFYGIGLLNVLGNATKAVTAAWRLLIDSGMFANFPGFLYLKSLAKQLTNQFRVPPGGGMPIDTVGQDIRASIMPLPYKDPSAVFMQLIDNVVQTAQRVGGTAEMSIGEGKQDAPVGTTLALIEQATKLMSAVHKRLHHSQGQEFDMLKSLLMEDPEALWRHNKKSKVLKILTAQYGQQPLVDAEEQAEQRHRAMFLAALSDIELVPRADPNTSSQTERYLKVVAMRQMAETNPNIDLNEVDKRAFRTMGVDDGESLFKPPPPPGAPPPPPSPEDITAQATITAANARMAEAQTNQQAAAAKVIQDQQSATQDQSMKQQEFASKEKIANLQIAKELVIHEKDQQAENQQLGVQNNNDALDRAADMRSSVLDFQQAQADRQATQREGSADRMHKMALAAVAARSTAHKGVFDAHAQALDGIANRQHEIGARQHEIKETGLDRRHEHIQGGLERQHEAVQNALSRQHELDMPKPKPGVAP